MRKTVFIVMAALLLLGMTACGNSMEQQPSQTENIEQEQTVTENTQTEVDTVDDEQRNNLSGTIPDELEYIPDGYRSPSEHPGTLEKLTYQTWESFSYDDHAQELTKEAWVYLPYGYSEEQKYNVFYLSHGGWSNETSLMGTDEAPHSFKYVIDHAIEDGKIQPLIIVLPTYNNTSGEDSGNYSLALQLTDQFHNELLNDLVPAVESKYSTYAEDTTSDGLIASRDHRGFGGFSMGSVNTWCTFWYGLGYFRYFMPMSGGPAASVETIEKKGRAKAHIVEVLTKAVHIDYLAYLRKKEISYIFAGKDTLDCWILLEKLHRLFSIERLMIAGGGLMNWSFVQEGLLDELSIVMAPVADGSTRAVSIFEKADFLPARSPAVFKLKEAKTLDGDTLWLRYTRR